MTIAQELPEAPDLPARAVCAACLRPQVPRRFCVYCGRRFIATDLAPQAATAPRGSRREEFDSLPYTGPAAPQGGVARPEWSSALLPSGLVQLGARVTWLGVRPGIGESTMASLLPGSVAGGRQWPLLLPDGEHEAEMPVVLLVPADENGIELGTLAARQWASGAVEPARLLGAVFIPTAPGRLPRAVGRELAVLGGGFPRVWWMPWLPDLRQGRRRSRRLPPAAQRLLDDVMTLTRIDRSESLP